MARSRKKVDVSNPRRVRILQVFTNLVDFAQEHGFLEGVAENLDEYLNSLYEIDRFGTEGQLDPRGAPSDDFALLRT